MKIQNPIRIAVVTSCVMSFANAPAVIPPPDGGIRGLIPRKALRRFKISAAGWAIQGLAGIRSSAMPAEITIPVRALVHWH